MELWMQLNFVLVHEPIIKIRVKVILVDRYKSIIHIIVCIRLSVLHRLEKHVVWLTIRVCTQEYQHICHGLKVLCGHQIVEMLLFIFLCLN